MNIYHLDHVQIAIPAGGEDQARAFYGDVLGLTEVPKPANLQGRGGLWLTGGDLKLHLGVDSNFVPARKAHPAFLVHDLDALVARCLNAGYSVASDEPLAGYDRTYVYDPFGNRIELMQLISAD